MQALHEGELAQPEVDRLFSSGRRPARALPRDLALETLAQVRAQLAAADGPLSSAQVAGRAGVARVTARRYLEYLAASGEAQSDSAADGPGRPAKTYTLSVAPA